MARTFLELAREEGLVSGVSFEDGRATCNYHLSGKTENDFPTPNDVRDAINEVLGKVTNLYPQPVERFDDHAGKIRRKLPKCHPFLEMPAAGITTIAGQGKQQAATPIRPLVYGPVDKSYITRQFTNYSNYRFTVEFRRRNYFLKSDERIARLISTYYRPGATMPQFVYSAKEWERFTWRTFAPMPDTVSTEYGQMKFRAPAVPVDGAQFVGSPFVHLQNQAVEVTWYQVPLRYFFDYTFGADTYRSYLTRFVNTVNQNAWFGYAPGTLLFKGATPEPYVPAVPDLAKLPGFLGGTVFDVSESLLCNVKLNFIYTARTAAVAPNPDDLQFTSDKNIIPSGHNLQPNYTDRKFYYVSTYDSTSPTTTLDQTKWKPCFESFPFELLFTDPLLKQSVPI